MEALYYIVKKENGDDRKVNLELYEWRLHRKDRH